MESDISRFARCYRLALRGATAGERAAALHKCEQIARAAGLTMDAAIEKARSFDRYDQYGKHHDPVSDHGAARAAAERAAADARRRDEEESRRWRRARDLKAREQRGGQFELSFREKALVAACQILKHRRLPLGDPHRDSIFGEIDGYHGDPGEIVPASVRLAVQDAYPLPSSIRVGVDEWFEWQRDTQARQRNNASHLHPTATQARISVLAEWLSAALPDDSASTRAWIEWYVDFNDGYISKTALDLLWERIAPMLNDSDRSPTLSRAERAARIKAMLRDTDLSMRDIAARVGVSPQTVSNLNRIARIRRPK